MARQWNVDWVRPPAKLSDLQVTFQGFFHRLASAALFVFLSSFFFFKYCWFPSGTVAGICKCPTIRLQKLFHVWKRQSPFLCSWNDPRVGIRECCSQLWQNTASYWLWRKRTTQLIGAVCSLKPCRSSVTLFLLSLRWIGVERSLNSATFPKGKASLYVPASHINTYDLRYNKKERRLT